MNTTQKTITETVLNSFMIFREIEIISQEENKNGRNGATLNTKFKEEENIYMLKVSKAGKTVLYLQGKEKLSFKPIHKYIEF